METILIMGERNAISAEWIADRLIIENENDGRFTKQQAIKLRNFLNQLELGE